MFNFGQANPAFFFMPQPFIGPNGAANGPNEGPLPPDIGFTYAGARVPPTTLWGRLRNLLPRKIPAAHHFPEEPEVEAYRKANGVLVEGRCVPKPILHLDESGFSEPLTNVIEALNYGSSPTPLQAHCWPAALRGRDVVVVDCTATKVNSLAYLVPAIVHVQHKPDVQRPPAMARGSGPIVLVLTATREAAQQADVTARKLCGTSRIRTICLVSGGRKEEQLEQLKQGADILIATPGRLVAFMEDCKVNLRRCTYLVIEEANHMFTMGLDKQLRIVSHNIRPDRQTFVVLESQTNDTDQLVEEMTKDPVTVTVAAATQEDLSQRVEHIVFVCKEAEKEDKLFALLNDMMNDESDRAIVFVERKQTVDELSSSMRFRGWPAVGIHGKKTEHELKWSLDALRSGKASILVATDVAARDINLDNVRCVVSYDYPSNPSEYPRRLKHVTRSDATARKCTFLEPDDYVHAREMIRFFRQTKQAIPPQLRKLANMASRK
ncbi:hypothetical protein MTO96_016206 [Rhipicephalus appendiculatus]